MLDRIAELFIFGFAPLVVGMLAVPTVSSANEDELAAPTIYGRDWVVELVDGVEKMPERRATFRIEQSGKINGKGFCNGYFASARIDGSNLAIGQAGSTQMACAPELMAADHALFEAFDKAASYEVGADGLALADKDGRAVVRFSPL